MCWLGTAPNLRSEDDVKTSRDFDFCESFSALGMTKMTHWVFFIVVIKKISFALPSIRISISCTHGFSGSVKCCGVWRTSMSRWKKVFKWGQYSGLFGTRCPPADLALTPAKFAHPLKFLIYFGWFFCLRLVERNVKEWSGCVRTRRIIEELSWSPYHSRPSVRPTGRELCRVTMKSCRLKLTRMELCLLKPFIKITF